MVGLLQLQQKFEDKHTRFRNPMEWRTYTAQLRRPRYANVARQWISETKRHDLQRGKNSLNLILIHSLASMSVYHLLDYFFEEDSK